MTTNKTNNNRDMKSGIYEIINLTTRKKYIGSSKDIPYRLSYHLSRLSHNKHRNKYLQNSFNKHGANSFVFRVIEYCPVEVLLAREQIHIDATPRERLYNLTIEATGGGSDVLSIPLYIVNLNGIVEKRVKSGSEAARFLNKRQISYSQINTKSVTCRQYRLMTPEFYRKNQKLIQSWNKKTEKIKNSIPVFYLEKEGTKLEKTSAKDVAKYLGITTQRVYAILKKKVPLHTPSGWKITKTYKN